MENKEGINTEGIDRVEEAVKPVEPKVNVNDMRMTHSDTIGHLSLALAKAQGAMKSIGKDKAGYGYKYMTLGALIDNIKEPMSSEGLAFIQSHYLIKGSNPSVVTETMITHESGEWIKSSLEIPITAMKGLSPAQTVGVVSTYGRRYMLQAMVGVAADDDTDGTVAK